MTHEVTAYPSPLSSVPVDDIMSKEHADAKFVISQKPELCKSHTVLVVDNSGSMQTHDIPLHRDRQVAAYTTMALEYVAEQIFSQTSNNRDVISLVEFGETARVVFTREPCSWVLYNMLLERREASDYKARQGILGREEKRADSNYLPALEIADSLLDLDRHDECALGLLFFSDGEPSDARQFGWAPLHARNQICATVSKLATKYGEYLNMSMVGFGNASGDFSTLQAMVDACNGVMPQPSGNGCAARATFVYCAKMAHTLGTALSSLATSVTELRTSLMGRASQAAKAAEQKRVITSESEAERRNAWRFYKVLRHGIYGPAHGRLVDLPSLPPGAFRDETAYLQRPPIQPPKYLALNGNSFGAGAERIAFRCFLSNSTFPRDFTLGAMVAKETNLVNRINENAEFHEGFCETQGLASYLADEFNKRIRATSGYDATSTPIIKFLSCSLVVLQDHTVPGGSRSVLVEKMLDTDRFKWTKWNDNGGGVEGKAYYAPLDIQHEMELLTTSTALAGSNGPTNPNVMDVIMEEDSDVESDDESDSDVEAMAHSQSNGAGTMLELEPSAYMQAFSHFTYAFTRKKVLVCDLQGIYNTDLCPPTFELTDPAIHYRSAKSRKMVYGRTDKGTKGIDLFFATHKCSNVCKLVCVAQKNNDWQKGWHEHHGRKYEGR